MAGRKHSRKHMSKRGTRKGIFGYLYGPVDHTLKAVDNVSRATANTLRDVVSVGVRGVDRVGRKVTGHADKAVSGLLTMRKRRNGRKTRRANKKNNK